jgi:hypothetical protein
MYDYHGAEVAASASYFGIASESQAGLNEEAILNQIAEALRPDYCEVLN